MSDRETKLTEAIAWLLAWHDNPIHYDSAKIQEIRNLIKGELKDERERPETVQVPNPK